MGATRIERLVATRAENLTLRHDSQRVEPSIGAPNTTDVTSVRRLDHRNLRRVFFRRPLHEEPDQARYKESDDNRYQNWDHVAVFTPRRCCYASYVNAVLKSTTPVDALLTAAKLHHHLASINHLDLPRSQ